MGAIVNATRKRKVTTRQSFGGPKRPAPPAHVATPLAGSSGRKGRRAGKSAEELAREEKLARIAMLQKRLAILKARQVEVGYAPAPLAVPASKSGRKGRRPGRT